MDNLMPHRVIDKSFVIVNKGKPNFYIETLVGIGL